MLSAERETYQSFHLLDAEVRARRRPLVIWIGAGVSAWAGYPLWDELAAQMHSSFSREESTYDAGRGAKLLAEGSLPALFQLMRDCKKTRYFRILAQTFAPNSVSPTFARLLRTISKLSPLRILTTNVDESLERNIRDPVLLQRSDFERALALQHTTVSFVCKLHGSISNITSTVFSTEDYELLAKDTGYLRFLREVFANSNVIFLGYSVRDDYVVKALLRANDERHLFGAGEHFVVCPEGTNLSSSRLRPIRYVIDESTGHRSCLQVLDAIVTAEASLPQTAAPKLATNGTQDRDETIYFIADLLPPGTWRTSQTVRIVSVNGVEREMLVGEGYVDGEVQLTNYSALHDIVVGLLCFDKICFTLGSLGKVHSLLGSQPFWRLVDEGAIRIVHSTHETALIYPQPGAIAGGDLGNIELGGPGSTVDGPFPMTVLDHIRRALSAAAGQEREAERLFERLAATVSVLPPADIPAMVRGALAHPSLRRLLGISGGTSSTAIPRWAAFPVLRLAGVIATGQYCQHLNAVATRLLWGSERLASAAFSAAAAQEWADDAASYVLTGYFSLDVGSVVAQNPEMLSRLLAFRQSEIGESFRREIAARVATNDGGELVASINSGLKQSLSISTLENARESLSGLFVPREPLPRMTPAIWGDLRNGNQRIGHWRKQSKKILVEACRELGIQPYDQCPCGSGEKLKFCCQDALRE